MESPLIQTEPPVQPMDIPINNENPQDLLDVKPQVTIVTNESTLSTQLNESQHNQSQVIVNIEVSNISIASDLQVQNNSSNGLLQPSQAQIQQEFVQSQSAQGNDNSQKLNGMMINIVKPNDEKRTDGEEGENTSPASRLKDRSPHLKLLAVSTESTLQPESANTSNTQEEDSNNLNPNVTLNVGNFANMKKCYSQAEIPAVSGNYGDTQTLKPATGIKRINSVNNFDAPKSPEESKQEPVSASQKQKISMNDFTKITSLGRGSYAEVFLVKKNSNGKLYALKALDKNFMLKEKKQYQAHVEKEVLLKMNHPNIIKLFSSFQDDLKLYFALEYVNGGEFSDYLRVQGKLPKEQVIFFAAEIINILEYIHIFGIAHRDMKPENILLTQEGHLKCIDFGTAKFLASDKRTAELYQKKDQPTAEESLSMSTSNNSSKRNHRSTFVGTPQYVSPEMLEGSDCGAAADLWSLGCMLYLMASGQYPFADTNEYLIFQKIKNVTLKFPDDMDADVKDLIQKLLVKDPMMRLGAGIKGPENNYDMLKAHPLFKNIDFSTIHEQKPPIAEVASPHKKKSHDLNTNDFGSPMLAQPNRKHYNSDDLTKVEPKVEFPTDKAVKVVLSGLVLKKCGWLFYKPRQLILNSKPKLVYYDPDTNQLKGEVLLAPTTKAELESKTRFVITAPNKKYFFKEMEHSAEKWVELINNTVTQLYAKK